MYKNVSLGDVNKICFDDYEHVRLHVAKVHIEACDWSIGVRFISITLIRFKVDK